MFCFVANLLRHLFFQNNKWALDIPKSIFSHVTLSVGWGPKVVEKERGTILELFSWSLLLSSVWSLALWVSGPQAGHKGDDCLAVTAYGGRGCPMGTVSGAEVGWRMELLLGEGDQSSPWTVFYPSQSWSLFLPLEGHPYSNTICFTQKLAKVFFHLWKYQHLLWQWVTSPWPSYWYQPFLPPFLRALEAQNEIHTKEKEKLIDKIQEMQEASDHLKKQFETESEVKCNFRQEASRLTLENRVRSLLTWW